MIHAGITVAVTACLALVPPEVKPRELRLAVLTADTVIRANDVDPSVWQHAYDVPLDELDTWYANLSGHALEAYERLRNAVRDSRGFNRRVTFILVVKSATLQPTGDIVLRGTAGVRRGDVSDFYTRDEKKQISDLRTAIRTMKARHVKAMRRLSPGSEPYDEIEQRHLDTLDEVGRRIWTLRERFEPNALDRMVAAEAAAVRVTVPKALVAKLSAAKLPRLRSVEVVMPVSDFHIRSPLLDYDQPAAVGMISGTAQDIVAAAYRTAEQVPAPAARD